MANEIRQRKAQKVGAYYEKEGKIEESIQDLMRRLKEMRAAKERTQKQNRQYLALRVFELFFENTELGRIFSYNRGELFKDEDKVETLLLMFEEVAEKIKEDNDTFGLKNVDFSASGDEDSSDGSDEDDDESEESSDNSEDLPDDDSSDEDSDDKDDEKEETEEKSESSSTSYSNYANKW